MEHLEHAKPQICLFGTYLDSQEYSRNRVLRRAIGKAGFHAVEIRPGRPWNSNRAGAFRGFSRFFIALVKLVGAWMSLGFRGIELRRHSLIYVPYPAHLDILLARLVTLGRRPFIVMDAFLGLHDTIVGDRGLLREASLGSRTIETIERLSLSRADLILIDTQAQKELLCATYQVPAQRIEVIPVGIDETIWSAAPYPDCTTRFLVSFWGTFIPLHGVETILHAARILESQNPQVEIRIVGDGQTAGEVQKVNAKLGLTRLTWARELQPLEELRLLAEESHCVLGIFGESAKAERVVPYKVYQALATGRPVVTRESPTMNELGESSGILKVRPGEPQHLAEAIDRLARNPERSRRLALEARKCYERHFSARVIEQKISNLLESVARNTR